MLARVLARPAVLKVPRFGPELVLGRDGARELAFADQRVRPDRLIGAGHVFRHPRLDDVLAHLLGRATATATAARPTVGEPV